MSSSFDFNFDFSDTSHKGSIRNNELMIGLLAGLGLLVLSWLVLYCFAPKFVTYSCTDTCGEPGKVDPIRCLAYSLAVVIIAVLLVWLFKSCANVVKK